MKVVGYELRECFSQDRSYLLVGWKTQATYFTSYTLGLVTDAVLRYTILHRRYKQRP